MSNAACSSLSGDAFSDYCQCGATVMAGIAQRFQLQVTLRVASVALSVATACDEVVRPGIVTVISTFPVNVVHFFI